MDPLERCDKCRNFNVNCTCVIHQCDHWLTIQDRRCPRPATRAIHLYEEVTVSGVTMGGTYAPGEWRFCTQHAQAFDRAR